jgi:hypothetical protein
MLAATGWPNRAASADEASVLIATRLTTPIREAVLAGRKIVLIANSTDSLIDPERKLPLNDRHNFPMMLLRERAGTPWDGQGMGAFTWRRMDGPWSDLPGGPMLDEHWSGLSPNHVLTGFPSTAFGGLVDAGMAVGWLHHAAAFVKRSFLGQGWLTVSTFDSHLTASPSKSAGAPSSQGAGGKLRAPLSNRQGSLLVAIPHLGRPVIGEAPMGKPPRFRGSEISTSALTP